jgi:hypothetical protein
VSARAFFTGVAPTLMPLRLAGGGLRLGSRRRRGRRSREDRHVQAAVAITHHVGTHLSVDGATPPISGSNTARTHWCRTPTLEHDRFPVVDQPATTSGAPTADDEEQPTKHGLRNSRRSRRGSGTVPGGDGARTAGPARSARTPRSDGQWKVLGQAAARSERCLGPYVPDGLVVIGWRLSSCGP